VNLDRGCDLEVSIEGLVFIVQFPNSLLTIL